MPGQMQQKPVIASLICEAISSSKNISERKYLNHSAEFRQDHRRLVGNKKQLPRKYRENIVKIVDF